MWQKDAEFWPTSSDAEGEIDLRANRD